MKIDGVLKSFALPKTPPTESSIKRLAIQTEDHPLEYADFEDEILQGHYSAGTGCSSSGNDADGISGPFLL